LQHLVLAALLLTMKTVLMAPLAVVASAGSLHAKAMLCL
jgi:hypothetical protein